MSRSAPRSRNFSAQKFAKCLQFFCIFGAATHQKSAGIVTETARSKRRSWLSRWCVCFRRIRARGSRCARAKIASRKIKLFFFKFELFEFVQTCCDVGEPRSQSARTFPARAPHKTPDVDAHVSLVMSQNGAFGPEIVEFFRAKIREVVAFFLRHRRRNALKRRPASLQKLN